MTTSILKIDYDDIDQATYAGVILDTYLGTSDNAVAVSLRFMTGDPVWDWAQAISFLGNAIVAGHPVGVVMRSSSCDHFVTDGDRYAWQSGERGQLDLVALNPPPDPAQQVDWLMRHVGLMRDDAQRYYNMPGRRKSYRAKVHEMITRLLHIERSFALWQESGILPDGITKAGDHE